MKLTPSQLRRLRSKPCPSSGNKVVTAIEILRDDEIEITQAAIAAATGFSQPYVSAVIRGVNDTITVDNGYAFATFFGTSLEDLFPARQEAAAS